MRTDIRQEIYEGLGEASSIGLSFTRQAFHQQTFEKEQYEVDLYRKHARWYGSAFLVMQKRGAPEGLCL